MTQIASPVPDASEKPPRSKLLLAWMIVSQILALLAILALGGLGIFGVLLQGSFDLVWFFGFLAPLLMLIPLIASWFAYGKRKENLAWILTSVPLVYVCLDVTIMYAGIFF